MTTRAQVLQLIESGSTYEDAGARLGIPPGQAYLVATGIPCDGGDALAPEDGARPGVLPGSTQGLCNPPPVNPTRHPEAIEWVRRRALVDEPMHAAADACSTGPAPIGDEGKLPDAVDVLRRRHNQVAALLRELKRVPGVSKGGDDAQLGRRETIVDMVTVRLTAHESAEERHFWPMVRAELPAGPHLADEATAQEQRGSEVLQRLSNVPASEPEFDELAQKLARLASIHVAFEDRVFLDVRAVVPDKELGRVGRSLVEAHELRAARGHGQRRTAAAARRQAGTLTVTTDGGTDGGGAHAAPNGGRPQQ